MLTDILRRLVTAFPRPAAEPVDRYCPICDGYHPEHAVRFTSQRLYHAIASQPLPLLKVTPVNEDWVYPDDSRHSGVSRESTARAAGARDRGRNLW